MNNAGLAQLRDALAERVRRLDGVKYIGYQKALADGNDGFDLWWDPRTGTSFAVHPGETMAAALERVDERFKGT